MEKQMENKILKTLKKIMVIMMVYTLLTVVNVSSVTELDIIPLGEKIESDYPELE